MKIAVVGTGYVGLVTATCLAEVGNNVNCVDIDKEKVLKLKNGQVPIYEPGLDEMVTHNIAKNKLTFTTELNSVVDAEVIFLALPTPSSKDGSADLTPMLEVSSELGRLLDHYTVIINKSTVPVGTADRVHKYITKHNSKAPIDVVSNPEFLREGFAVNDFMHPDRIIVGTNSVRAKKIMRRLYAPFVSKTSQIFFMDERSAEMTKYAANSFLATKLSFINEVSNLCEYLGADIDAIRLGIGADERIGPHFLSPGIGYGGSCFPKDVRALKHTAKQHNYEFKILEAVNDVNESQKHRLVKKAKDYYKNKLNGKTFALWGLAFKPDTDDIREAPSLNVIDDLLDNSARVVAYDPEATNNARKLYSDSKALSFAEDMYKALMGADALFIVTEWDEFRSPDFAKMKEQLKEPIIFDGRNLYDIETMNKEGFYYQSFGRATTTREDEES